jgi:hypothetical protein
VISQTTYNRLSVAVFAIIIAKTLVGCSARPFSDGPVQSYELDGSWCTNDGSQVCLTVRSSQSTGLPEARYWWSKPGCQETGDLTGGLEFTPDTDSRLCIAPEPSLYSASAYWNASGLSITVDQAPSDIRAATNDYASIKLELTYIGAGTY